MFAGALVVLVLVVLVLVGLVLVVKELQEHRGLQDLPDFAEQLK